LTGEQQLRKENFMSADLMAHPTGRPESSVRQRTDFFGAHPKKVALFLRPKKAKKVGL
jgi:hypothetical protein